MCTPIIISKKQAIVGEGFMRVIIILAVIVGCLGCVSTQVKSYTDTKYTTYQVKSLAILALSDDVGLSEAIENSLAEKFSAIAVKTTRSSDILPPTRAYTVDEIKDAFTARGFYSLLIVDVGGTTQSSDVVGYQSYGRAYGSASGTAYTAGNATYVNTAGSASGTTTSYAMRSFKRDTITYTKLYDIASTDVIWVAQTKTKAGGALFMSDNSTGSDLASNIINELTQKGHLPATGK